MHVTMPELAFFFITLPFSLWAAWTDLSSMRITNRMNILLFCTFLVSGLIFLPLTELGIRVGVAFAALAIGFVLNATGRLGGGDGKYIAAFIGFIDPREISLFFFILAVCLLTAVAVHRGLRRIRPVRDLAPGWKSWSNKKFPVGLGLSGALSLYLAIEAFNLPFGIG